LCEKESNDNLKSILHHFYQGYKKKNKDFESILDRLEKVKLRGRKKLAFG
jgi:tRNA A-37 threonylcarbamoyl transferase component Bud32